MGASTICPIKGPGKYISTLAERKSQWQPDIPIIPAFARFSSFRFPRFLSFRPVVQLRYDNCLRPLPFTIPPDLSVHFFQASISTPFSTLFNPAKATRARRRIPNVEAPIPSTLCRSDTRINRRRGCGMRAMREIRLRRVVNEILGKLFHRRKQT